MHGAGDCTAYSIGRTMSPDDCPGAAMTTKLADDDQVSVWQAEGVVMELLGCGAAEAALLLRWRALIQKRGVVEAAAAVLSEVSQFVDP